MCAHHAIATEAEAAVRRHVRARCRAAAAAGSQSSRTPGLSTGRAPDQAHSQHQRRARQSRRLTASPHESQRRSPTTGDFGADRTCRRRLCLVLVAHLASARRCWKSSTLTTTSTRSASRSRALTERVACVTDRLMESPVTNTTCWRGSATTSGRGAGSATNGPW